jgi:hypothetical protein
VRPNNPKRPGGGNDFGRDRNRNRNPQKDGRQGQPSTGGRPAPGTNTVLPVVTNIVNAPDCVLCSKKIQDLSTAVVYGTKKEPVHFECIVTRLEQDEQCTPMEKIIYIGGGQFAVVNGLAYRNNKVEIIRKIKAESIEDRVKSVLGEIAVKVD